MQNLPGNTKHNQGRDDDNENDRTHHPFFVGVPQTMNDQHEKDVDNKHKLGAPIPKAQRGNADWEPEARLA